MSEFLCQVVTVTAVEDHPSADTLDIAHVWGYPVVVRRGEYQPGDLASYIPVDAILPRPDFEPEFASVYKYTSRGRVRAARLRGQVSHGLLWRVPPTFREGDDVAAYWGIKKYDDSAPTYHGHGTTFAAEAEPDPGYMPKYDVENLRRWPGVLERVVQRDPDVVVTEKLHGTSSRFLYTDDRLWVGSRNLIIRPESGGLWAQTARYYTLAEKLRQWPDIAIYGEIVGVQDLKYGLANGQTRLYLFDAYNVITGQWSGWFNIRLLADFLGIPTVPVLYHGPWRDDLADLYTTGPSQLGGNLREGIVIRPEEAHHDGALGRVILKSVSDDYLMRKEAA